MAVPEKSSYPRGVNYKGKYPDVPEQFEYLIGYLGEIGGLSTNVLTWSEIKAWSELFGIELESYELRCIKDMSGWFVDQYYKSVKPECPSPWVVEGVSKEQICNNLKSKFAMISKSRKGAKRGLRKAPNSRR